MLQDWIVKASDWIAIAAAIISLAALTIAIYNGYADRAIAKANERKGRVWTILSGEPGIRTISALDVDDGQTTRRIELLERTASHLDVADASSLAKQLRDLLSKPWGAATTSESRKAREAFFKAVPAFMNKRT
jgi:hypothetical protein